MRAPAGWGNNWFQPVACIVIMKMREIIHIYLDRPNTDDVNIGQIVLALANAQKEAGLVPSVWCIGCLDPKLPAVKFPFERFDLSKNSFGLDAALLTRLKELPDGTIVHLHGGFVPAFYAISRKLEQSGRNIHKVLSPHGSYNEYRLRKLSLFKRIYYYLYERKLIRDAAMVHLLGPTELNGFNFYMEKTNSSIVCLPDGESFDNKGVFPLRQHDGTKDPFVITFSGTVNIHEKGLDLLIAALSRFATEVYSSVELWVIGSGPDENALRELIRKHDLQNKVRLFGSLEAEERKEKLLQSQVFVHPSRTDVIPATLLEAASIGLPLIVTEETNLGGFVRQYESGWCLPQNTEEQLIQALHEAYLIYKTDDESYSRLHRNSFKMIREALNWNTLAKKWKEVYASIL
jgi:glycosyltransferase involved in cell wall biosynthesis